MTLNSLYSLFFLLIHQRSLGFFLSSTHEPAIRSINYNQPTNNSKGVKLIWKSKWYQAEWNFRCLKMLNTKEKRVNEIASSKKAHWSFYCEGNIEKNLNLQLYTTVDVRECSISDDVMISISLLLWSPQGSMWILKYPGDSILLNIRAHSF